ncbi:hypothetical protein BHM03_00037967 [Ensete ventricosum]|nr:hypothetical protein BHM03_00037967 [Ensete ventricosum]
MESAAGTNGEKKMVRAADESEPLSQGQPTPSHFPYLKSCVYHIARHSDFSSVGTATHVSWRFRIVVLSDKCIAFGKMHETVLCLRRPHPHRWLERAPLTPNLGQSLHFLHGPLEFRSGERSSSLKRTFDRGTDLSSTDFSSSGQFAS